MGSGQFIKRRFIERCFIDGHFIEAILSKMFCSAFLVERIWSIFFFKFSLSLHRECLSFTKIFSILVYTFYFLMLFMFLGCAKFLTVNFLFGSLCRWNCYNESPSLYSAPSDPQHTTSLWHIGYNAPICFLVFQYSTFVSEHYYFAARVCASKAFLGTGLTQGN